MCEATVYLEQDGQRKKVLEDVFRLKTSPDGVVLRKLMEPPQTVQAIIHEIDFARHTVTLVASATSNATLALILKRRSIRSYTDTPVSETQIQGLLQTAMAAPSANDVRPWAFVVVRDPARRLALAETHQWSQMCADAPVVIAVVGDPAASDHWVEDCSAATENLLLAAAGLELGAVWIGIYPRPQREAHVRRVLNIPEQWRVLCLVPVGYPAETKPPRTRYEASKVYFDSFRGEA